MTKYNTNLAAEFYVLSALYRLSEDAYLTLGNKKAVDIVVARPDDDSMITVEVKGLAGKTAWPVDNVKLRGKDHFVVLVSFLDKISDPSVLPAVYIVPADQLEPLIYTSPKGWRVVQLSKMKKDGKEYQNNWDLLRNIG